MITITLIMIKLGPMQIAVAAGGGGEGIGLTIVGPAKSLFLLMAINCNIFPIFTLDLVEC